MSSERMKGADDKNVCQNKVSKNTRTSSARECRGDQAYVSLHILNKLKGYKASKLPVALHVCERWCVCVCVCRDQSKACINPMCQSGKNQAQLGSRTVERGEQVRAEVREEGRTGM